MLGKFVNLFSTQKEGVQNSKKLEEQTVKTDAATVNIRNSFETTLISQNLNPTYLKRLTEEANQGNTKSFFILAEEMEERDLHYAAVLQSRKIQILNYPIVVEVPEDNKLNKTIAEELGKLINSSKFSNLKENMVDAIAKGYSVSEIIWQIGKYWMPVDHIYCQPYWFKLDKYGNELDLIVDEGGTTAKLDKFKFVIHKADLKTGSILRDGLARGVMTAFMCKVSTLTNWLAYLDKCGMPTIIGKYDSGATGEDIDTLEIAVQNVGTDNGAVLPKSMEIEIINGIKEGSTDAFEKLEKYLNAEISKRVLGQTMTTENGSSLSQAKIHENTQNELILSDAKKLVATLNEQLISYFIELNWGIVENPPQLKVYEEEVADVGLFLDNLKKASELGLEIPKLWVHKKAGIPVATKNEELVELKEGKAAMMSYSGNVELMAAKPVVDEEVSKPTPAMQGFSGGAEDIIIEHVEKYESLEEANKDIDILFDEFNFEGIQDELALSSFATSVNGDASLDKIDGGTN